MGQRIRFNPAEKKSWDSRFKVIFQREAWDHEDIMKKWIAEDWNNAFLNPPTPGSSGKILLTDVHTAQKSASVNVMLHKCNTSLINIPWSATSVDQPLEVVINKPFNNYASETKMDIFLRTYGLSCLIRVKACIELFLANSRNSFKNFIVISAGLSDFH